MTVLPAHEQPQSVVDGPQGAMVQENPRREFSEDVKGRVGARCERRCALCFILDDNSDPQEGQFAHIEREGSTNAEENCAFLCFRHHNWYDSKPSAGARVMPVEL